MLSLFRSVQARYGTAAATRRLSAGVRGGAADPAAFPYRSLREFMLGLHPTCLLPDPAPGATRPTGLDLVARYPWNDAPGWTNKIWGVATDGYCWFFSAGRNLVRIPAGADLGRSTEKIPDAKRIEITRLPDAIGMDPTDFCFGNLSYHDGLLYAVRVDRGNYPCGIMVFDVDLEHRGTIVTGPQSWTAVGPDGSIYVGNLLLGRPIVDVFAPLAPEADPFVTQLGPPTGTIQLCDEQGRAIALGATGFEMRGATISAQGCLYVTCNGSIGASTQQETLYGEPSFEPVGTGVSVVWGFELPSGRRFLKKWPGVDGSGITPCGLTILPLPTAELAPPNVSGQLHVVNHEYETIGDDDIYFAHFAATPDGAVL